MLKLEVVTVPRPAETQILEAVLSHEIESRVPVQRPPRTSAQVWLRSNVKSWPRPTNGAGDVSRNDCNNWPQKRARFFPLAQHKRRPLTLYIELGEVQLTVDYG